MKFETTGLVLTQQNIGENDKLITVLTEKMGIIRAFVRGAKRISSTKLSSTQIFCYSHFSVYSGKDKYIINDASPIELFFNIHKNIEALALAQYICELSLAVVPQNGDARDFLRLALNALHFISTNKKDKLIVKSVFEMKSISLAGYMPDLIGCKKCGTYESEYMFFSFEEASLYCNDCLKSYRSGIVNLPPGVLTAMRHIIYSDFNKIFSFNLSEENTKLLSEISEKYILHTLRRNFNTLQFYKNLL